VKVVELAHQPVELYKVLKWEGVTDSGAAAKSTIVAGLVMVNGEIETRKRRKIVVGDIIAVAEEEFIMQLK
tara:strand:- start:638 stop:850 length:213 start_codon:yes stop_codon:yes gene_type:complete